jgi:hypothetical protein
MSEETAQETAAVPARGHGAVLRCVTGFDLLVYPSKAFYVHNLQTQNTCGGVVSLLLPAVFAAIMAVIVSRNAAVPDVSQTSMRDLALLPPLFLQLACTTADASGNANPLCPGVPSPLIPPPIGFQFVPTLSDMPCALGITRLSNRTASQPWLSPHAAENADAWTSPAIAAAEVALGTSAGDIGGRRDPFQILTFAELAADLNVETEDLWTLAGTFLAPPEPRTGRGTPRPAAAISTLANVSSLATDRALAAAYPRLQRTDLISELSLDGLGEQGGGGRDPLMDAAVKAAGAPVREVLAAPVPLCPFPSFPSSAALRADPPTSGLGFLFTLPPYFNFSALLTAPSAARLVQLRLSDGGGGAGLPANGVVLEVAKGANGLGGAPFDSALRLWQWYARSMAYSDAPALLTPYIAYDVAVTRTVAIDGTVRAQALATVTTGTLTHGDASNYYGWGDFLGNAAPHLAACGDVYALGAPELDGLYSIAVALGYPFTRAHFLSDGSWALADLLPPVSVEFALAGGCGAAAAALEGWPRPACEAAQALRAAALTPTPLFFNASLRAAANASLVASLVAIYAAIDAASNALVHRSLLPWPISQVRHTAPNCS